MSPIGRRVISFDYENRVTNISDSGSNQYNAQGMRIKKSEGTVEKYYFFNDYEEEYDNGAITNATKYYFANNQRIAENSTVNGIRFYHQDHLGSSVIITDSNGAVINRTVYLPYGSVAVSEGAGEVAYKFTGKELDDSGLYYFGARFYDPEIGRFISVDPIGDGDNWYAYCGNNPVRYVDPSGLCYQCDTGDPEDGNDDYAEGTAKTDRNGNTEFEGTITHSDGTVETFEGVSRSVRGEGNEIAADITIETTKTNWTNPNGTKEYVSTTTETITITDSLAGQDFADAFNTRTSSIFGVFVTSATIKLGPEISIPLGFGASIAYGKYGPTVHRGDTITEITTIHAIADGIRASASVTSYTEKKDQWGNVKKGRRETRSTRY